MVVPLLEEMSPIFVVDKEFLAMWDLNKCLLKNNGVDSIDGGVVSDNLGMINEL